MSSGGLFGRGQGNGELTAETFLAHYWQQKPLLIRQAFPGFSPELDADDIAGLACDELAESRIVTGSLARHDWQVQYGPLAEKDFSRLGRNDWTLLVQDVEKHYPPLQRLLDEFSFLPRWRIDDLMVSVAGPGGSVGPHVDQYDVFLLQAQGTRRWQIAGNFDPALLPDCELNVLQSFDPEEEWTLEPGDMLYLPPGIAHHGVALDRGMTWSIGMRAPSEADLLQSLGEWLATCRHEGSRYADPGIGVPDSYGEIDADAISRFRDLCQSITGDETAFSEFLGSFLSSYRLAHLPASPDTDYDPESFATALKAGSTLMHNPWSRLLWLEAPGGAMIFAGGSMHSCSTKTAMKICDPARLGRAPSNFDREELSLCCRLVNQGHLYLALD
jgi:50S ribosomal protein L16 3-hydroxylase